MNKKTSFIACVLGLATALGSTNAFAENLKSKTVLKPPKITVSTGYHYSKGDYGATEDTTIKYIPTTAKVKYNNWTAKVTVPHLEIRGPGIVVGGSGDGSTGSAASPVSTESGLGDVMLSLQKKVKLKPKGTSLKLTGKLKLPTADEDKKLGTGKADFIFETGLSKTFGRAYVTGKVGRKFAGRTSRYDFRDTWRFGAGGGYQFLEQDVTVGAIYNFKQSSSETGNNSSQVTSYIVKDFNDDWSAQLYGIAGLSDGSADHAMGLVVSRKFTWDPRAK